MPSAIPAIQNARLKCAGCGADVQARCMRDLTRKRYCSKTCANRATTLARNAALPERACDRCGTPFKPANATQRCCTSGCYAKGQVERSYKYLNDNPRAYLLLLIKKDARRHLTVGFMLDLLNRQGGKCALTGVPMTFIKRTDGVKQHTNLSIDRIDSTRGYEEDNIQLVCAVVNVMKTTLSVEELRWWCAQITAKR